MREPRDSLRRYAYGFTDQKPHWTYWLLLAVAWSAAMFLLFVQVAEANLTAGDVLPIPQPVLILEDQPVFAPYRRSYDGLW